MAWPYLANNAPDRKPVNPMLSVGCGVNTCDLALHKNSTETPLRLHTRNRSLPYSGNTMRDAFAFWLPPERTSGENLIQKQADSQFDIGCGAADFGWVFPETKPGLTGQDIKTLVTADSQTTWCWSPVLCAIEIDDTAWMVESMIRILKLDAQLGDVGASCRPNSVWPAGLWACPRRLVTNFGRSQCLRERRFGVPHS